MKSELKVLLIGPFEPNTGLHSFVTPPLGVWRITGFLKSRGIDCRVFDPNLSSSPYEHLSDLLNGSVYNLVGISVTSKTLPYDMSFAHMIKKLSSRSILVAGGVEATFNHRLIMSVAPLDMVVLGEGELPLLAICEAIQTGRSLEDIQGTVTRTVKGLNVLPNRPMSFEEFRDASLLLPLGDIPFRDYWKRLESMYRPDELNDKKLQEIYSIRLMTLNYCPLKCSFCSYTNFLDFACDRKGTKVWRLPADDVVGLVKKCHSLYPEVRTVIFQDDLFTFKNDKRLEPLCEGIASAAEKGMIRRDLKFISTSRADFTTQEYLALMKKTGFRLIGYGIESFSKNVLNEFNKETIFNSIEPAISNTLKAGMTPFLNVILSSPGSSFEDIMTTLSKLFEYQHLGCESSIYPYVIPFKGSAMADDAILEPYRVYQDTLIPNTETTFRRPVKILPKDPSVRGFIEEMEASLKFDTMEIIKGLRLKHLPPRVRATITLYSAAKALKSRGIRLPYTQRDAMALIKHRASPIWNL